MMRLWGYIKLLCGYVRGSTEIGSAGPDVTFSRDFSEIATDGSGVTPSNTTIYEENPSGWFPTGVTGATAVGGKWLRFENIGADVHYLTLDDIGVHGDFEILVQVRHANFGEAGVNGAHTFLRASQSDHIYLMHRINPGGTVQWLLYGDASSNQAGATQSAATPSTVVDGDVWWMRHQVIGSAWKAKLWKPTDPLDPEVDEPGSWQVETTVPVGAPTTGYAAIGVRQGGGATIDFGFVSVSIDPSGTPAPYPTASGGGGGGEEFMFTDAEFTTWQDKWANGPYKTAGDVSTNSPAEVTNITNRKDAFLVSGVANWPPASGPAGSSWTNDEILARLPDIGDSVDMVHAALFAAITGDTTARDAWKTEFDSHWQAALLDFSNTTLYPPLPNAQGLNDEHMFHWSHHIGRLLAGYDYISHVWPTLWTSQQQADIAAWFLAYGAWTTDNVYRNMGNQWSGTRGDVTTYTTPEYGSPASCVKLSNGTVITCPAISRHYNNRRMSAAFIGGCLCLRFGGAEHEGVSQAATLYKELLVVAQIEEGYFAEHERSLANIPSIGLGYLSDTLGMAGMFAEYHRRVTGSPTLLDTEVSVAVDVTDGSVTPVAPRTLLTMMQEYAKHFDGTTNVYYHSGAVESANLIDGWHDSDGTRDNWKTAGYVGFALPNTYYQDAYVNGLIYQTGSGMPGYPASPSGGAWGSAWGGPNAQIIPSMPLQYMDPS